MKQAINALAGLCLVFAGTLCLADDTPEYRRELLKTLWSQSVLPYHTKALSSGKIPDVLYNVQGAANLLFDYALKRQDTKVLREMAALLLLPYARLTAVDQYWVYYGGKLNRKPMGRTSQMWVGPQRQGEETLLVEEVLSSSQFLFLVARAYRSILSMSPVERDSNQSQFLIKYAPILMDHYRRWVLENNPDLRIFQVEGWGCSRGRFNHLDFLSKKLARAFGDLKNFSHCNAVTDLDLWILAGASELSAIASLPNSPLRFSNTDSAGYEAYLRLGADLLKNRMTLVRRGQSTEAFVFDYGAWRDHYNSRYARYTNPLFPVDNSSAPILNGAFEAFDEAGAPVRWAVSNGTAHGDPTVRYTGTSSVALISNTGASSSLTQSVAVRAGKKFKAFVKTRTESATGVRLSLHWLGATGNLISTQASAVLSGTRSWRGIELSGRVPAGSVAVTIGLNLGSQGKAFFDDARFLDLEAPASSTPITVVAPMPSASVAMDSGHSRRFVQVFETMHLNRRNQNDFPTSDDMRRLANQFAYGIFNGNYAAPLFRNFFDGSNGWYRINYSDRVGFGFPPYSKSSAAATGGYCFWQKYQPEIAKICGAVWLLFESEDPAKVGHRERYFERSNVAQFEPVEPESFNPGRNVSEMSIGVATDLLNFIASYDL